jgi:hypothetical protein
LILEHKLGLRVEYAMGMETLNSAARAAGFAMASDDPYEDVEAEVKVVKAQWRPGEAILLQADAPPRAPASGDWLKGMLALFGRRAPVSPA